MMQKQRLLRNKTMKDKKSFTDLIKNIPLCINPCKMCKIYKKHNKYDAGDRLVKGVWGKGVCDGCCWFYDSKFEIGGKQ